MLHRLLGSLTSRTFPWLIPNRHPWGWLTWSLWEGNLPLYSYQIWVVKAQHYQILLELSKIIVICSCHISNSRYAQSCDSNKALYCIIHVCCIVCAFLLYFCPILLFCCVKYFVVLYFSSVPCQAPHLSEVNLWPR